jgi:protein-tyrosine-phosphatase
MLNTSIQQAQKKEIPAERRKILLPLSEYISRGIREEKQMHIMFICTHNSRRSHIAQCWAQAMAEYYSVKNIHFYSAGTQATAFNPRAVQALQRAGFRIERRSEEENPVYRVYTSDSKYFTAFSKQINDARNPVEGFAAIMVCSQADQECPYVKGCETRIAIPYEDPKQADGTSAESAVYDERSNQIAAELAWVFKQALQRN